MDEKGLSTRTPAMLLVFSKHKRVVNLVDGEAKKATVEALEKETATSS